MAAASKLQVPLLWPGAQESCSPPATVHQATPGMPSILYNTASRSAEAIERTHRHRLGRPCTTAEREPHAVTRRARRPRRPTRAALTQLQAGVNSAIHLARDSRFHLSTFINTIPFKLLWRVAQLRTPHRARREEWSCVLPRRGTCRLVPAHRPGSTIVARDAQHVRTSFDTAPPPPRPRL